MRSTLAAVELAHKLSPTEVEAYRNWAARQSRWYRPRRIETKDSKTALHSIGWMRGSNPATP